MSVIMPVLIAAIWLFGFLAVAAGYLFVARRDAIRAREQFSPFTLSVASRLMLIVAFWPLLLGFWMVLKIRGEV